MIDSKIVDQMLEKILEQTQQFKMDWKSIPQYFEENWNEPLRKFLIEKNRYAYNNGLFSEKSPLISEYGSLCLSIDGGTIIILLIEQNNTTHLSLALQVNNTSKVIQVDCTNQELLLLDQIYKAREGNYDITKFVKGIIEKY